MIGVAELAAGREFAPVVCNDGRVEQVLLAVDLDSDIDSRTCDDARRVLARSNVVAVGVATRPMSKHIAALAAELDLTLASPDLPNDPSRVATADLATALEQLELAVGGRPRAALVLTALLRQTAALPVDAALAAEASAYSTLLAGPEYAAWLRHRGLARETSDDDQARVRLSRTGNVLDIRLTRAGRRNAIDARMRLALAEALRVALADERLRVRLSGDGPVFCSGGDLDEFGTTPDPATAWVVRMSEHPGRLLDELSARAEVRLHGACAGAGVELAAFAGRCVASPESTFHLPELGMGLLPGAGGTVSMPRRIGRWRTAFLALTGTRLAARQAHEWGLVDEVADVG
jgi:hypothetical protein